MTAHGKANWTWNGSTSDGRALTKASASDRVAAIWYAKDVFNVDLSITDGKAHRVTAYFLDWDHRGRSQTVEIRDRRTGAVLDRRTVSGFGNGRYITWNVSGDVRMKIIRNGPSNAVLSGIFFDAAG